MPFKEQADQQEMKVQTTAHEVVENDPKEEKGQDDQTLNERTEQNENSAHSEKITRNEGDPSNVADDSNYDAQIQDEMKNVTALNTTDGSATKNLFTQEEQREINDKLGPSSIDQTDKPPKDCTKEPQKAFEEENKKSPEQSNPGTQIDAAIDAKIDKVEVGNQLQQNEEFLELSRKLIKVCLH